MPFISFLTLILAIEFADFASVFSDHLILGEKLRAIVLSRNFKKLETPCAEKKIPFASGYCRVEVLVHGKEWRLLCKDAEHFMHRYYKINEDCFVSRRQISHFENLIFQ